MLDIKELDLLIVKYKLTDIGKISRHFKINIWWVKEIIKIGFEYSYISDNDYFPNTSCFHTKFENNENKFTFFIYRNDNDDIILKIYDNNSSWGYIVQRHNKSPEEMDILPLLIDLQEFLIYKNIKLSLNFREFTEDLKK